MNISKSLEKVFSAFGKLNLCAKIIIKYGTHASLAILLLGTILLLHYQSSASYSFYTEFIAKSIVKTSFILLAESIIGGFVIDFVFKKA